MKNIIINGKSFNVVAIFENILENRSSISKFLKGKSGIYALINKVNGKAYVGSSINLRNRISDYLEPQYLVTKNSLVIVRAILKYGQDNFQLVIQEFTEASKKEIQAAEQHYLDSGLFEYNTSKIAGNTLGVTHSKETREKLSAIRKGFKHSEETRKRMSEDRRGVNNSFYGKTHSEENKAKLRNLLLTSEPRRPGYTVHVLDCQSLEYSSFRSTRQAAKFLNCSHITIMSYNKSKKFLNNRYLIDYNNI